MAYEDWWKSLSTEQRYDFDSDGRGYKKDCGVMMRMAWEASAAAEREACAELCDQRERDPLDDEAPLVWLRAAEEIRKRSNV